LLDLVFQVIRTLGQYVEQSYLKMNK
jgi:hypothetical protein